ncbi:MAG: hypothetical protein DMG22_09545 [Acidobacteria bacterium]|nr:MAG: hypothetical protein DMG22_09545 [Acidobacteriota bacterium]
MNIADVVSGQAKWRGIQWALFSATARKVLAAQLRAILPARALLGPLHPREVRFKPGRELTAYYDAHIYREGRETKETHCVRPIAVSWGTRANWGADITKAVAEAERHSVAAPFLQLMADFPAWSMRIQVSPLDTRFTQLARLSDPRHVRAMLADAFESGKATSHHQTSDWIVTSIKYRPGRRHVLRYDPGDPANGATLFAKVYIAEEKARAFRREDGARTFRVACEVADAVAEHCEGVDCLRPLAYLAEDAVILYPKLCGVPLSAYARRLDLDSARWLRRAGAALRTLHRLPVALAGRSEPHDLSAEIRSIVRKSDPIAVLLPHVGSAIEALLDRVRELHDRLPQEPATFTHGDLKTEHIWVAADGLTVMDFDSARPADPALDIGYFLADWQFQQAAWDQAQIEGMYESFFAGYAASAPKDLSIRARLCEAVELLKCAVRRVPLFEKDWASRIEGLVDHAEAAIDDVQRTLVLRT